MLREFATRVRKSIRGIDLAARYGGEVQADFQEGQSLGISGTPTFVINGKALVGFQPLDVFEQAIEDARREAEGG